MSESIRAILEVSELNEVLRALVEDSLPSLWVQGEISNLSKPASGHWYFTLKDSRAQIRCAMFRKANFLVRPVPSDGDAVLVRARAGVYPARGELQLIVEHLEKAGDGALLQAFEELKNRLLAEGLFDAALKRPIPPRPGRIGLITSATGAAIHDVLSTLGRRWPLAKVFLYPVPVQGVEAPGAIVRALDQLPKHTPVDVILLVRGGGSIEDLWAFNDERVARAIRACAVPVVSGVGHEVDTTIADFAADLRAPTPTAAAELASPDIADWIDWLEHFEPRAGTALSARLERLGRRLGRADERRLRRNPQRRLLDRAQRLDELSQRLLATARAAVARRAVGFAHVQARLAMRPPQLRIAAAFAAVDRLESRAVAALRRGLLQRRQRLEHREQLLGSLNPKAVLGRGYAIARAMDGRILRSADEIADAARFEVLLARGRLIGDVRERSEE